MTFGGGEFLLQLQERLDILGAEQGVDIGEGRFNQRTAGVQVEGGQTLDAVEGGVGEEGDGIETGFGEILGLGHHGEVLRKG